MTEWRNLWILTGLFVFGATAHLGAGFFSRGSFRGFVDHALERRAAFGKRPQRPDSPFGFGLRGCIACLIFGGVNLLENLFLNHRVLEEIAGILSDVLIGDPFKLRVRVLLRRCR